MYVDAEGRDWPGGWGKHLGNRETAVHRHSLNRLNVINDFLNKKITSNKSTNKSRCGGQNLKGRRRRRRRRRRSIT